MISKSKQNGRKAELDKWLILSHVKKKGGRGEIHGTTRWLARVTICLLCNKQKCDMICNKLTCYICLLHVYKNHRNENAKKACGFVTPFSWDTKTVHPCLRPRVR